jgi:TonB-linked SusC/RagA family outer membrane protein
MQKKEQQCAFFSGNVILKTLLLMKLIFIFTVIFCIQASANVHSQTVSLTVKNMPINKVLLEIEKKTKFRFLFSDDLLPGDRTIDLSVKDEEVTQVLNKILVNTSLTYRMLEGDVIAITAARPIRQRIRVSGRVTNEKGEPVPGATIIETNTKNGTSTDNKGNFSLNVENENSTIEISSIGYATQVRNLNGQTQLSVVLKGDGPGKLDEIVVIGYGTTKKTSLTAAVSTLKGGDVAQKPVVDLSNSLVGRVPGIIADQGSGEPGLDGSRIRIRGSSTTGNADPLLVVDGIPRSFAQLDPNSIESFTILKDAAAVAPYGLAGANGVILITTKKGKAGMPSLSYNGYVAFQNPARMPKMVNAYQYALLQNEGARNSGLPNMPFSDTDIAEYKKTVAGAPDSDPDKYPNSSGLRDVLKRNAVLTYHNMELSGGTEKIRYYAALGFTSQQGQFATTYLKKYNVNTRVEVKATNTTNVSLGLTGYVVDQHYSGKVDQTAKDANDKYGAANGGIMYQAFRTPPTSAIYYSNGLWGNYIGRSLVGYIYNSGYALNENTQLLSTFSIEQQLPFLKGLSVKGVVSYDPYNTHSKIWRTPVLSYAVDFSTTPYTYTPGYTEFSNPQLSEDASQNKAFTYQTYINYHNTFGSHAITFLAVAEARNQKYWSMSAGRTNYPINIDELDQGGVASGEMTNGGSSSKQAQVGYLYRLSYSFAGKYLAEASGRYDGHYYFAPGKRYAFFPAFSLGWNMGQEKFLEHIAMIDKLKLRASYGESGNLAGEAFQYLTGYSIYGNAAIFNGNATTGVYENSQANPNITWERARKFNLGVEGSLWKGLLTIEADYFQERRSNMLVTPNVIVPVEYGIGLPQVNGGIESNHGIELSLGTAHSFKNGLRIEVTGNFTYAQNKLLQIYETDATYKNPNRRRTGRANGTQFGLKALGYFTPDDFTANGKLKPGIASIADAPVQPGDLRYADLSGADGKPDGIIDDNDETVIGRPNGSPQMIYGLSPTIYYKGFDLNFLLQGAEQVTLPVGGSLVFPFDQQGSATALVYNNHWTPANTSALYPRVYSNQPDYNTRWSSWWLRNAAYLKLRNLELGYSLSNAILKPFAMQRLRAYIAAQNLWTWTPHMKEKIDPEARSSNGQYYFQQRVFSVGLNVTF